jgi:hypothetical protein
MNMLRLEDSLRINSRYPDQARAAALERPRSLAQAVERAAKGLETRLLKPVTGSPAEPAFQSTALLALLTFCYARRLYSSAAIAQQLRRDFTLARADGFGLPDSRVLQEFRSLNRWPLDLCLQAALRFLAEEKIRQGIVTRVKEDCIKTEASRRIVMAMFTDSLEAETGAQPEVRFNARYRIADEHGRSAGQPAASHWKDR